MVLYHTGDITPHSQTVLSHHVLRVQLERPFQHLSPPNFLKNSNCWPQPTDSETVGVIWTINLHWPTFFRRVDLHRLAEWTHSFPVISLDFHLKGSVRCQALIVVHMSRGLHMWDSNFGPRCCAFPPERQDISKAIPILVLPGHGLQDLGRNHQQTSKLTFNFSITWEGPNQSSV